MCLCITFQLSDKEKKWHSIEHLWPDTWRFEVDTKTEAMQLLFGARAHPEETQTKKNDAVCVVDTLIIAIEDM